MATLLHLFRMHIQYKWFYFKVQWDIDHEDKTLFTSISNEKYM